MTNATARSWTPKAYCIDCGTGLRFPKTKRCTVCFEKWRSAQDGRPHCLRCGKVVFWTNKHCRECHWAIRREENAQTAPKCLDCGGPVSSRATERCMGCIKRARDERAAKLVCRDCGGPVSVAASERCMSCRIAYDNALGAAHVCSICGKKARAHNLCPTHHRASQRTKQGVASTTNAKILIGKAPCAVCGYARMNSDVHRFIPGSSGGKYTAGNMVPLCKRCHGEVHAGITPCPQPS